MSVASQLPLRVEPSAFDPLLCADLHNQIIAILKPSAEEQDIPIIRNFFVAYGDQATEMRDKLSQPLITFLENIDIIDHEDNSKSMYFTPHLWMPFALDDGVAIGGLGGTRWDEDIWEDEENENWIALYLGREQEHAVYFNMDLNLCTWQQEVMPWMRNWYEQTSAIACQRPQLKLVVNAICNRYPLDRALRLWLSLYKAGKFQPNGPHDIYHGETHRRYVDSDLKRDLKAYNELLAAIQTRCPGSTINDEPGLVDAETLDEMNVFGFNRDFYLHARRPSFTYIAPGLEVPSSEWIRQMLAQARADGRLQQHANSNNNYDSEPLPLFPGPKVTLYSSDFNDKEHRSGVVNDTSGLYGWPDYLSGDAVRLVLPSPIGANGWVREGNDEFTTEEHRAEGVPDGRVQNDALYQYGWCPFLPRHLPTFSVILNNWKRLIEDGVWKVGPDGVEGGIETWKQADTEEHCLSYRIGVCLDD